MRLKGFLRSAAVVASLALMAPAWATTIDVTIEDNRFSPDRIKVRVGDVVRWQRASSSSAVHNVRQDDKIFRSGDVTPNDLNYARRFSAGSFHYYCEAHGARSGAGMDGIVKVPVTIETVPSGAPFTVRWATGRTNTGTKFDVQYRVGSGAWRTWKSNTGAATAVFGGAGEPNVTPGKAYSFRARSQKSGAQSLWSPAKTLKV